MGYDREYRTTQEKASPFNYAGFVAFIKESSLYQSTPAETMRGLRDWTKMLYEQCGAEVYTTEERCAALAAVDIAPDWCSGQ